MRSDRRRRSAAGVPRKAAWWAALVAALLAALSGCASIPDSSAVSEVGNVQPEGQQEPHVRVFALPPQGDEDALTIVGGFLEALTSDEAGFDTARQYLTKKAQETWRPEASTVVYDRPESSPLSSPLQQQDRDTVTLTAEQVASVDQYGLYQPSRPGGSFEVRFHLAQVNGQWRIAGLPRGVYLSRFDFQRLYRPLNAYFFDPAQRTLVPDPVYLPSRPGQLAALVKTLLRGPSRLLGSAVGSYFPPGTRILDDQVPVEGGVPHVRLNRAVLAATPQAREALIAQLVWTVRELGYGSVRITAAGGDFSVDGASGNRTVQQYQKYDPHAQVTDPIGHFEQKGQLWRLLGRPLKQVPGPFGSGPARYRSFAVAMNNDQVAAVTLDGRQLFVGGAVPGAGPSTRKLTGTSLSRPSYDAFGRIWVVDRRPAGSQVHMLSERGIPERIAAQELDLAQVEDLRISPDGTRVAVLVRLDGRTTLRLGRVEPRTAETNDGETVRQLTISGMRRVADPVVDVEVVSWSGPGQLTLLGKDAQEVLLPFRIDFDGSALTAGQGVSGKVLQSIAAAEDQPLLAATSDGKIAELGPDGQLEPLGEGRSPIYPG